MTRIPEPPGKSVPGPKHPSTHGAPITNPQARYGPEAAVLVVAVPTLAHSSDGTHGSLGIGLQHAHLGDVSAS
jgi:hypothetical protein